MDDASKTDFCTAVIKYTSNYDSDIYVSGYEIWRNTETGEDTVLYTNTAESKTDNFYYTNLYQIVLENFKHGIINSSDDTEGICMSVLHARGAVVLEKGTHYDDTYTDLEGNAFGDTFELANVPMTNASNVKSGALASVFADTYKNSDGAYDYTIIYTADPTSEIHALPALGWNVPSQFAGDNYGFENRTKTGMLPCPAVANMHLWNRIKHIVIDEGITSVGSYGLKEITAETLVYPSSLSSLSGRTFASAGAAFDTCYIAHSDLTETEGIVDLSNIASVSITEILKGASGVKYLHLPKGVTSGSDKDFNGCNSLLAVWCGDSEKPADGTIDLSNSAITKLAAKDSNPQIKASNITALILPGTCVSIGDGALSGITVIIQQPPIDDVKNFCIANGIGYNP